MAVKTVYVSKLGKDHLISPHFKLKEFQSKDGADKVLYSEELLAKLEEVRAYGGFIIPVNSGYRSPAHNKSVGGATNSNHTKGLAADVKFKKDGKYVPAELICALCVELGFNGVAYINANSVHLDVSPRTYRGDERYGYENNIPNNDFYKYFGITKAQVEALKVVPTGQTKEEETEEKEMTEKEIRDIVFKCIAEMMTAKAQELPSDWSAEARDWAKKSEIIKGTNIGDEWKSPVDREQLATIIYRVMQLIDPIK